MEWSAILLFTLQWLLIISFSFFAFFNYLYGIASLWTPRILRTKPSGKRVGVVIVAFNEKDVIEDTIRACEALSYTNKLVVLADDSNDPVILAQLRQLAVSRGCQRIMNHAFFQEVRNTTGQSHVEQIEIWESPAFVLFHRPTNTGFKGGSLQQIQHYLAARHIELMYLLDADWHPQRDALERTLEVLEADERLAFVQTKRISFPQGMNRFQKYVALVEEGCYHVDFAGRQALGHPTLFSGCCTLFRLDAVTRVGGFTPGHLTEDLDLTNRLWLDGWKGVYLDDVVNYGEVPFVYDHYRRQQERWAAGSARALRDFFWPIVRTNRLSWIEKFSAIRQNAYFTSTLLTGAAIPLGMITILWLAFCWNTYAVEYYLYYIGLVKVPLVILLYGCILSNFVEPLVTIFVKRRRPSDLLHLPMTIWYAWSVLPAYIIGNIKGLFGLELDWFRTPKFQRSRVGLLGNSPGSVRALNLCMCTVMLGFYFSQGWVFGWFDEFALLWIPAFLLASVK